MRGRNPGIGGAGHRTPLIERMIDGKRLPLAELAGTGHRGDSGIGGAGHRTSRTKKEITNINTNKTKKNN